MTKRYHSIMFNEIINNVNQPISPSMTQTANRVDAVEHFMRYVQVNFIKIVCVCDGIDSPLVAIAAVDIFFFYFTLMA